jgi:HEAT repeat protein
MMGQAPISLETLKLKLISGNMLPSSDPLLTRDGIRYLLKALAYADADFSAEIEYALVKAGSLAVPELIKSLASDNNNVRSTAAMALIRLGSLAEEALLQAYPKYSRKPSVRWVFQFVLQELGLEAEAQQVQQPLSVVALEKVG